MSLGKLVHYGFDFVLISMLLAAVRRNTGFVLLYQSSDLRKYISKYLGLGEQAYDWFVSTIKHSGYFGKQTLFDSDLGPNSGSSDRNH